MRTWLELGIGGIWGIVRLIPSLNHRAETLYYHYMQIESPQDILRVVVESVWGRIL